MKTEYLRHEYTWSSHCISGNRLGWGMTASSVPEEKEHLRELEKLAQAAVIDKTGRVAVEELGYSPRYGFIKMVSLPCESGEDMRQNKRVTLFEPQGDDAKEPAVYLAPGEENLWEEQRGFLPPVTLESNFGEPENILKEIGIIDRLPAFMKAVFWCLFGKADGLNIVASSWKEEAFAHRAASLMYVIHQFLPACLRRRAGYVSFTREEAPAVSFYFSGHACGEHCFFLNETKMENNGEDELSGYFFQEFAASYREKNEIYTKFMAQAERFLAGAQTSDASLKKLEWIFYGIARKKGKEPLSFSFLAENYPELLYWTAKDSGMVETASFIAGEIHRHNFTEKERKFYVNSLLSGMTGRARELVIKELDWILSGIYSENKAQFARLLADIREKNRDAYTTLLCSFYPEEAASYGKDLFDRNASEMKKLYAYVSDLKEGALPPAFKDHILRTGIGLLNEKIFDKKRYELFDKMAIHLKREGQWAEILKDFVGQLEDHASALDRSQLDTACYVEELLCKYRPKQNRRRLREERRNRGRKKKTESSDGNEEDGDMGRRYKGQIPESKLEKKRLESKTAADAEIREAAAEREDPLLPFLFDGFPQGFLTGCIIYLSHHSLMIGHWKIALGMVGMWILLMLNYECLLLQKRNSRPFWKVFGLCLVEGWLIEAAAWFFRSQKIRLYYFIALGILTVVIQVINLIHIKRRQEE